MTKLAEFQSIKERDCVFDRTEITSFNNLHDALINAQGENIFFRGQASARWRIFSSIQREWIQKDLNRYHNNIDDFVSGFLKFCHKELLIKINAKCKEPYDVSILSMLQHYGAPTPFVDFTSNPDVALYFAVIGNDFIKGEEIDNFFSIYVVEAGGTPAHINNDLMNFEDILSNAHKSLEREIESANSYGDSESLAALKSFDENRLKSIDCLTGFTAVYIKETGEGFLSISNKRMDLQNGLFLYQGKNSIQPLELHFSGMSLEQVHDVYEGLPLKKIKAYDVHKDVLNEANQYLAANNIDNHFLGLGSDDFGKVAFEKYLLEIMR